ncbi:ras-related protein Rab-7b-like isoform X2 [Narcine bancroftii]
MSTTKSVNMKIIIIGSIDVGKTALLDRYVNDRFIADYCNTLGVNLLTKQITVENTSVKLQIWDTGGQERFKALVSTFYKGSDGCVLTFDVTNRDSFYTLEGWRNAVLNSLKTEQKDFPFTVLGNKIDLPYREITSGEAEAWCEARNISYYEVSAKEGTHVEQAFENIARLTLAQISQNKDMYLMNSISLEDTNVRKRRKCC